MSPPVTLPNPRHETFAVQLARGLPPAAAYVLAGFSSNNALERGTELAEDPEIAARVQHLRDCLPHSEAMRDRYAPSLLLMPETLDEMLAWLWQVMNGTRKILPLQLRAATLFTRLKGWHKSGPHVGTTAEGNPLCGQSSPLSPLCGLDQSQSHGAPAPPPDPAAQAAPPVRPDLMDVEKSLIARQNRACIQTDTEVRSPDAATITGYYSKMADYALAAALQFPETRPIPFVTNLLAEPTAPTAPTAPTVPPDSTSDVPSSLSGVPSPPPLLPPSPPLLLSQSPHPPLLPHKIPIPTHSPPTTCPNHGENGEKMEVTWTLLSAGSAAVPRLPKVAQLGPN